MHEEYKVIFFKKRNGEMPVQKYLAPLLPKIRTKILSYIKNLSIHHEFRREPFSRHLSGKLRELKVDFGKNRHRIIYFFTVGKTIVLLHAFTKKTTKTPSREILKAQHFLQEYLNNLKQL